MTAELTPAQARLLLARDIDVGVVPALSIRQPWPHRIFHEGKDVENRDWLTRYRGWFLVHAGVTTEECAPSEMHLPRGGIVGIARIVDCVTTMDSRWFFGRFGFVLRDAEALPLTPCRGKLGFFYPPAEVNAAVAALVREPTEPRPYVLQGIGGDGKAMTVDTIGTLFGDMTGATP